MRPLLTISLLLLASSVRCQCYPAPPDAGRDSMIAEAVKNKLAGYVPGYVVAVHVTYTDQYTMQQLYGYLMETADTTPGKPQYLRQQSLRLDDEQIAQYRADFNYRLAHNDGDTTTATGHALVDLLMDVVYINPKPIADPDKAAPKRKR